MGSSFQTVRIRFHCLNEFEKILTISPSQRSPFYRLYAASTVLEQPRLFCFRYDFLRTPY